MILTTVSTTALKQINFLKYSRLRELEEMLLLFKTTSVFNRHLINKNELFELFYFRLDNLCIDKTNLFSSKKIAALTVHESKYADLASNQMLCFKD